MSIPKKIDFAGGGTAGHLFPALALAQEFQNRFPSCETQFWGTKMGIESRLQKQIGFKLKTIRIRGFQRKFNLSNIMIPFEILGSMFFLKFYFLFRRPDLVIGTGGYVSGPVLFIASRLGIYTAIHEQNSYPGATTKILSRWVKKIYLSYDESKKYFKQQQKIRIFGNPIREIPGKPGRSAGLDEFGLVPEKKTLFIIGGSQGGLGINKLMIKMVPKLAEKKIQVIWATGPKHFESIKEQIENYDGLAIYQFIDKMNLAYAASDLVICRAGATTVAELTYYGVPAILIPFPYATANHQEFNARELEKAGAAMCVIEKKTTGEELYKTVIDLLDNEKKLLEMKKNTKNLGRPNAANDIVSDLCNTLLFN